MGSLLSFDRLPPQPEAQYFSYPLYAQISHEVWVNPTLTSVTEGVRIAARTTTVAKLGHSVRLFAEIENAHKSDEDYLPAAAIPALKPFLKRNGQLRPSPRRVEGFRQYIASEVMAAKLADLFVSYELDLASSRQANYPPTIIASTHLGEELERRARLEEAVAQMPHGQEPVRALPYTLRAL